MKVKPLAALNYFKNNRRRTIPIVICSALSVFFIYIFSMYVQATFNADQYLMKAYESFSYVYANKNDVIDDLLLDKIAGEASTDRVIECGVDFTNFNKPIGGDEYIKIYKLETKDLSFMVNRMGLELKEGRLPSDMDEIALHERIAKSKNLKVGDEIGRDDDLNGTYKLTGILEGSGIIGVIPTDVETEKYKSLLVFHKNGQLEKSNDFLDQSVRNNVIGVITYKRARQSNKNESSQMNIIFNITQVIVIIVMTLAIVNLSLVHFYHRRREFGVLHAVGYSKKLIIWRILKELSLQQTLGYAIGIALAAITGYIIKFLVFDKRGLPLSVINLQSFIQTITIPVFMCIFNIFPVARMLDKVDSISIIQGKE